MPDFGQLSGTVSDNPAYSIAAFGQFVPMSGLYAGPLGELAKVYAMNAELDARVRGNAISQEALARALIESGQLQLGPEAFTSPAANAAIVAALRGVPMSSPGSWFGLAGVAPGGSFPLMPFGPTGGFAPSPLENPFGGGSLLGALGGAAINVGQAFLAQRLQEQAAEEAFKRQRDLLILQQQLGLTRFPEGMFPGGMNGGQMNAQGVKLGPDGRLVGCNPMVDMECQGPVWTAQPGGFTTGGGFPGGAAIPGACGVRGTVTVSPIDAPALYRSGCSGSVSTRGRFFALRSDGTRDLFVRVGKVQSVSPRALTRFARRWAREAGLVAAKRGAGGRRGRRRPR